jgi:hypothetical protein
MRFLLILLAGVLANASVDEPLPSLACTSGNVHTTCVVTGTYLVGSVHPRNEFLTPNHSSSPKPVSSAETRPFTSPTPRYCVSDQPKKTTPRGCPFLDLDEAVVP